MNRRKFITLLGGAAVMWPVSGRAQRSDRALRIGVMTVSPEHDVETKVRVTAFRETLEKLGWAVGRNVRIDYRWGARDAQRARVFAGELVSMTPDVILAQGSLISEALLRETRTIPIVFVGASDPMSSGLVGSMARPGGNLTGFTNFEFSMGGKWLEMLKEVAPGTKRMLAMRTSGNFGNLGLFRAAEAAAPSRGVVLIEAAIGDPAEIDRMVTAFAQEPHGGLIVFPKSVALEIRDLLLALAARHRIPAVYPYRSFATAGGLMSYDTDMSELYRRAASYVDRILRGEKPGGLPVQVPTEYNLVINLKTAKTLGLEIPLPLLALADEVIE